MPRGSDPIANLLGILIIETTVFGREIEDAVSLMTLADGVFEFTQMVAGEGIDVRSVGDVSRSGDREFTWRSQAEGRVRMKNIKAIEPFEAVMIPQSFGRVIDVLELPLVVGAETRRAHVVRYFTFTPRSELRQLQLRRITIRPKVDGRTAAVDITATIRGLNRPPTRRKRRLAHNES
jgi:hypothetical protein